MNQPQNQSVIDEIRKRYPLQNLTDASIKRTVGQDPSLITSTTDASGLSVLNPFINGGNTGESPSQPVGDDGEPEEFRLFGFLDIPRLIIFVLVLFTVAFLGFFFAYNPFILKELRNAFLGKEPTPQIEKVNVDTPSLVSPTPTASESISKQDEILNKFIEKYESGNYASTCIVSDEKELNTVEDSFFGNAKANHQPIVYFTKKGKLVAVVNYAASTKTIFDSDKAVYIIDLTKKTFKKETEKEKVDDVEDSLYIFFGTGKVAEAIKSNPDAIEKLDEYKWKLKKNEEKEVFLYDLEFEIKPDTYFPTSQKYTVYEKDIQVVEGMTNCKFAEIKNLDDVLLIPKEYGEEG